MQYFAPDDHNAPFEKFGTANLLSIVDRDLVLFERELRKRDIEKKYPGKLKRDGYGACIHVNKISAGCAGCFVRRRTATGTLVDSFSMYIGDECNANCGYCYYQREGKEDFSIATDSPDFKDDALVSLGNLYNRLLDPQTQLQKISYSGRGEPLLYPKIIKEASDIAKRYQKLTGKRIYSHLYTNGILLNSSMLEFLKSCEIHELRVHLSASSFDPQVIDNMRMAKEQGFVVSVEEPGLPECTKPLMGLLPTLNDIGIHHLNVIECEVLPENIHYLKSKYPQGKMYRDFLWLFYDEEFVVYSIIEEAIKNNYCFSVLDCNGHVENARSDQYEAIPEFLDTRQMANVTREFPLDLSVDFYGSNKTQ